MPLALAAAVVAAAGFAGAIAIAATLAAVRRTLGKRRLGLTGKQCRAVAAAAATALLVYAALGWKRVQHTPPPPPPFDAVPVWQVDTREQDLPELLELAVAAGAPVVLRGGTAHWDAVRTWAPRAAAGDAGSGRLAERLHDCLGKNFRLHLQTSVVEQDGGAGGFALASVREFAAWLQADAAAGAGGVISIVTSQYVPLNCFIPDRFPYTFSGCFPKVTIRYCPRRERARGRRWRRRRAAVLLLGGRGH
jgi:hypothetical protein